MTAHTNLPIALPIEEIQAFCQKWHVAQLALFGSVLRGDFGPGSDIDVLVRLTPGAEQTLHAYLAMRSELSAILGRDVDLVNSEALTESHNWLRRRRIMESARVVYAA